MLLSILYICLLKASSESLSQEYESLDVLNNQDNSVEEESSDSSCVTQIRVEIPEVLDIYDGSSSEVENYDHTNEPLSDQQNIPQVDDIFDGFRFKSPFKEDEKVSDKANPKLSENKPKRPTTLLIIKEVYERRDNDYIYTLNVKESFMSRGDRENTTEE